MTDRDRDAALYDLVKHHPFLCDTCGESHPLIEHRNCRGTAVKAAAAQARQAITKEDPDAT